MAVFRLTFKKIIKLKILRLKIFSYYFFENKYRFFLSILFLIINIFFYSGEFMPFMFFYLFLRTFAITLII